MRKKKKGEGRKEMKRKKEGQKGERGRKKERKGMRWGVKRKLEKGQCLNEGGIEIKVKRRLKI